MPKFSACGGPKHRAPYKRDILRITQKNRLRRAQKLKRTPLLFPLFQQGGGGSFQGYGLMTFVADEMLRRLVVKKDITLTPAISDP